MPTIRVERTARKRHRCAHCVQFIEPGERYVDARLPPGSELGNSCWWQERRHTGCYEWALRVSQGWSGDL